MTKVEWYDLGGDSMNAFVRWPASFPNIDHSFQWISTWISQWLLEVRFVSRRKLKNTAVAADKWSHTVNKSAGILRFTNNIRMATRTFGRNFDAFDKPNMYTLCLSLRGFLSSNVIHLSHACTFHSKTMWRVYSDLSVLIFVTLYWFTPTSIRLQQGRNAKLKILRFCRRDSN